MNDDDDDELLLRHWNTFFSLVLFCGAVILVHVRRIQILIWFSIQRRRNAYAVAVFSSDVNREYWCSFNWVVQNVDDQPRHSIPTYKCSSLTRCCVGLVYLLFHANNKSLSITRIGCSECVRENLSNVNKYGCAGTCLQHERIPPINKI